MGTKSLKIVFCVLCRKYSIPSKAPIGPKKETISKFCSETLDLPFFALDLSIPYKTKEPALSKM
jgi:hypothetical protein